jgi:hypothetical protein
MAKAKMHLGFDLSYSHMGGRWRMPGAWKMPTFPTLAPMRSLRESPSAGCSISSFQATARASR